MLQARRIRVPPPPGLEPLPPPVVAAERSREGPPCQPVTQPTPGSTPKRAITASDWPSTALASTTRSRPAWTASANSSAPPAPPTPACARPGTTDTMAHFKCAACRARVWRDGDADRHARDLCPGCGGPLEAVARAEEIIG